MSYIVVLLMSHDIVTCSFHSCDLADKKFPCDNGYPHNTQFCGLDVVCAHYVKFDCISLCVDFILYMATCNSSGEMSFIFIYTVGESVHGTHNLTPFTSLVLTMDRYAHDF